MLAKNLLQDDAVEPVTHWNANLSPLHRTSPNLLRRVSVGRSKDRALFLEHFLPDGNEPPPGSSNSNHRKEIDADSLEGRAKAFERKRYVSIRFLHRLFAPFPRTETEFRRAATPP